VFGSPGITAAATDIARLLFVVFLVLFVIVLFAVRPGSTRAMSLPCFPE
jgi:uncharacterized membrane protein YtjA (UPF0391 family)